MVLLSVFPNQTKIPVTPLVSYKRAREWRTDLPERQKAMC